MTFKSKSVFFIFLVAFTGHISTTIAQSLETTSPTLQDFQATEIALISLDEILSNYKPERVLDYDQARIKMYTEIYNKEDTITCMYTGYKLKLLQDDPNPIAHLMKLNPLKSIITEHSYPKSKGAKTGNAKSDMHHLFPVRLGVNIVRYNHPFAEISDSVCTTWLSDSKTYKNKPSISTEACAQKSNGSFEPKDEFKGNVARAVFYFYTMYREEALTADPEFFEIQRETLLKWHLADPVDALELKRTYQIANYQSGKTNPFILDETLALRLYSKSPKIN